MLSAALLAGIAGYVDAICYLCLGHAFAANMTGNLVEVGVRAAQGDWRRALWLIVILLTFVSGVLVARLALAERYSPRLSLLIDAALVALAGTEVLDGAAAPFLAAAMALQNEAVVHGILAINIAFITGDMQQLGERLVAELRPSSRRQQQKPDPVARIVPVILCCYALGAAVGTLASGWHAHALFAAAAALIGFVALPGRWTGLATERNRHRRARQGSRGR